VRGAVEQVFDLELEGVVFMHEDALCSQPSLTHNRLPAACHGLPLSLSSA
jgi:hypothetical protein